jgi:hypothetical protein
MAGWPAPKRRAPEIRLAVAEPDLDIGHVETVLDALTDACYYLTVERNRYHFSFKENLNKRYADRRANIKDDTIGERVRAEVQTVFATSNGIAPVFFPENSGKVPDKPALTFVVLSPEQSMEDEKRIKAFIDGVIREHGSSSRTYKSGLVFVVANSASPLYESARRVLAWEEIERNCQASAWTRRRSRNWMTTSRNPDATSRKASGGATTMSPCSGKNNEVRFIDLGNMHSSAAASIIQFIVNELDARRRDPDWHWPQLACAQLATGHSGVEHEGCSRCFLRIAPVPTPPQCRCRKGNHCARCFERTACLCRQDWERKISSVQFQAFDHCIRCRDLRGDVHHHQGERRGVRTGGNATTDTASRPGAVSTGWLSRESTEATKGKQPTPAPKPSGRSERAGTNSADFGLTWSGEVPSQKWMNFYTKVLTKLGVGNDLSLNVKVKCNPQGGVSPQKIEEIKSALRELGLDDNLELYILYLLCPRIGQEAAHKSGILSLALEPARGTSRPGPAGVPATHSE